MWGVCESHRGLKCFCAESSSCPDISINGISSNLELICVSDLGLGQETCFWRLRSVSQPLICQTPVRRNWGMTHVSSVTASIFNQLCVCSPGGLPGEHLTDDARDPQRSERQWNHHYSQRNPQLFLHDVRQHERPVQKAQFSEGIGTPELGQECASKENETAKTLISAQDQNPRPDRRERHRQMVTDDIPLHFLPLQPHLLALLRQLNISV